MFRDMCSMPEARDKLRSQCSNYLMERVIWAWNGAGALRTENRGQAQSKAGYKRGMKRQKSQMGLRDFSQDDYKSDINKNKEVKKGLVLGRKQAHTTGFSGWNPCLSTLQARVDSNDEWVGEERKERPTRRHGLWLELTVLTTAMVPSFSLAVF